MSKQKQPPTTRAMAVSAKQYGTGSASASEENVNLTPLNDSDNDPVTKKDIEVLLHANRERLKEDMSKLIDSSTDSLRQSVHSLGEKFASFDTRLRDTEGIVGDNFTKLNELEVEVKTLRNQTSTLQDRVDALENQSRRSNLRIVNIPEGSERDQDLVRFAADLIMTMTAPALFETPPEIERAHRALGPRPDGARKPRAFIIKFLRFQDKEKTLRWAREHTVKYRGTELRVYPDISTALAKKRAAFNPVKNALYQKGIKFRLLHPARLCVTLGDGTYYFDSAESAQEFYDQRVAASSGK